MVCIRSFVVSLRFKGLQILHTFFDLAGSRGKSVALPGGLCLHRHGLHPKTVRLVHRRELHGIATSGVEVDSKEGPLALDRVRYALDRADMDRDPRRRCVGDQNCKLLHVDVDLPW